MEVLILYKTDDDKSVLASTTAELLERAKNLSVKGFFIIDRAIFPAILANFLTYVIIIIQFRLEP